MKRHDRTPHDPVSRKIPLLTVAALLSLVLVACQGPLPAPVAGEDGIGDAYYPYLGNGGYDVLEYTLVLSVDPPSNTVNGEARIEARALRGFRRSTWISRACPWTQSPLTTPRPALPGRARS